jgi:hypothetical protein
MPNSLDSAEKEQVQRRSRTSAGWLRVAGVAAVSALAGGLAAAWWHRKTLAKLHQEGENSQNADFPFSGSETEDEA